MKLWSLGLTVGLLLCVGMTSMQALAVTISSANVGSYCWSPDGTRLAFMRHKIGNPTNSVVGELCVANADGSGVAAIYSGACTFYSIDWRGDWILFIKYASSEQPSSYAGDCEAWKIRADGSGLTQLTFTHTDGIQKIFTYYPTIGTVDTAYYLSDSKIAFRAHNGNGWFRVYICNADGSDGYVCANSSVWSWGIGVIPSTGKVLYTSSGNWNQTYSMYICNADGSGDNTLATGLRSFPPIISGDPSGTKVLYEKGSITWSSYGTISAINTDLGLINSDGSGATDLLAGSTEDQLGTFLYNNGTQKLSNPFVPPNQAWLASGQRVLYTRSETDSCQVWSIAVDGTGASQITSEGFNCAPTYSSDGKIAYLHRTSNPGSDISYGVMDLVVGGSSRPPKCWAVLVGVSTYNNPADNSQVFVNDVKCVDGILRSDLGKRWQNIVIFTNSSATQASIQLYLHSLTNYVQAGDVLLYMHSSHGGYDNDTTYVYCYPSSIYEMDDHYTDAELGSDLAMFNSGAKVIVLLESCFSGGMYNLSNKNWPFAERVMEAYKQSRLKMMGNAQNEDVKSLEQNIAFMTSCKSDQSSYGWANGLSWYIVGHKFACMNSETDTSGDSVLQFSELHSYAADYVGRLLEYYWNHGDFYHQTPQIYPENTTLLQNTDAITVAQPSASIIIIDVNGESESVVKRSKTTAKSDDSIDTELVTVQMRPGAYANIAADWWVLAFSTIGNYYLDSAAQWQQFDGNLSNCHPAYQGPLCDLQMTPVLNYSLPAGQYIFYFAVDRQDSVINLDEIWYDSVSLTVE